MNNDIKISMLINKLFFLSNKTPKNKDWWKQDFSKDVILFLNLTWISLLCILFLNEYMSLWFIVLGAVILFVICLISLLISFATWTEAKHIQLSHVIGEK